MTTTEALRAIKERAESRPANGVFSAEELLVSKLAMIGQIATAALESPSLESEPCVWREDFAETYRTTCGLVVLPVQAEARFCPFCAHPLSVVRTDR